MDHNLPVFLELSGPSPPPVDIAGCILNNDTPRPDGFAGRVFRYAPEAGPGADGWIARELATAIGLRRSLDDAAPVVLRAEIYRPEVRFYPGGPDDGGGFRYYMPDTAALTARHVAGAAQTLEAWLDRAARAGIETVWLHSRDAAVAEAGLDLDLAARTAAHFSGALWLSGGLCDPRHLHTAAQHGRVAAVVVDEQAWQRLRPWPAGGARHPHNGIVPKTI